VSSHEISRAYWPPPDEIPVTLTAFCENHPFGKAIFGDAKMGSYHMQHVQARLIELGAMTKAGSRIFIYESRFQSAWQQLQVELSRAAERK
jgi:hypothetical protein